MIDFRKTFIKVNDQDQAMDAGSFLAKEIGAELWIYFKFDYLFPLIGFEYDSIIDDGVITTYSEEDRFLPQYKKDGIIIISYEQFKSIYEDINNPFINIYEFI